ncbi:MAG: hypothetical protein ACYC2T_11435 [Bacillota bacterium]
MKKWKLLLFAVLVGLALLAIWRTSLMKPPREVSEAYLRALASGNVGEALAYSSVAAANAAERLSGIKVQALVRSIDVSVAAMGSGWARTIATVDLVLTDGTSDVGWYFLDVAKKPDGWKVIDIRESEPAINGLKLFARSQDEALKTFIEYLDALKNNRYDDAARLLVGPARKAHEQAASVLSKGPLFKSVSDVKVYPLWKQGKFKEARAEYIVDGRQAQVLVLFYSTDKGLRIVAVNQM